MKHKFGIFCFFFVLVCLFENKIPLVEQIIFIYFGDLLNRARTIILAPFLFYFILICLYKMHHLTYILNTDFFILYSSHKKPCQIGIFVCLFLFSFVVYCLLSFISCQWTISIEFYFSSFCSITGLFNNSTYSA